MKLVPRFPHDKIQRAVESDATAWLLLLGTLWLLWDALRGWPGED